MVSADRLIIFSDNSVEAVFHDQSHVLHLSQSGSTFVAEPLSKEPPAANGLQATVVATQRHVRTIKQRTEMVTTKYRTSVQRALSLRNRYTHCAPFLPASFLTPDILRRSFRTNVPIDCARWPAFSILRDEETHAADHPFATESISADAGLYKTQSLSHMNFPNEYAPYGGPTPFASFTRYLSICPNSGTISLLSFDRRCLFRLSANLMSICVIWPALVHDPEGILNDRLEVASNLRETRKYAHMYIWIQQMFSAKACPQIWKSPLELVLRCLGGFCSSHTTPFSNTTYTVQPFPTSSQEQLLASHASNAGFSPCHPKEIANAISLVWTFTATYRPVIPSLDNTVEDVPPTNGLAAKVETEAIMESEGSVLFSTDSMSFVIIRRGGDGTGNDDGVVGMFRVLNATRVVRDTATDKTYPLSELLEECTRLHLNASRFDVHTLTSTPPQDCRLSDSVSAYPSLVSAPCARSTIPGLGDFFAYPDGRVRVSFEDRAILELVLVRPDANGQKKGESRWRLLTTKGQVVETRCDCPVGMEGYVTPTVKFMRWAFATPIERRAVDGERKALERKLEAVKLRNQFFLVEAGRRDCRSVT